MSTSKAKRTGEYISFVHRYIEKGIIYIVNVSIIYIFKWIKSLTRAVGFKFVTFKCLLYHANVNKK